MFKSEPVLFSTSRKSTNPRAATRGIYGENLDLDTRRANVGEWPDHNPPFAHRGGYKIIYQDIPDSEVLRVPRLK